MYCVCVRLYNGMYCNSLWFGIYIRRLENGAISSRTYICNYFGVYYKLTFYDSLLVTLFDVILLLFVGILPLFDIILL